MGCLTQYLYLPKDQMKTLLTFQSQAFCFLLSCLLYRDTNTSISALESLHQVLLSATDELSVWFISKLPKAQVRVISPM